MNGHHLNGSDLNRPSSNGPSPIQEESFNLQASSPSTGHTNVNFVNDDSETAVNPNHGWPRPNSSDNFGTILGFLENGHLSVVNGGISTNVDMCNGSHSSPFPSGSASNQLLLINLSRLERRNFYTDVRAELDQLHYLNEVVVQFGVSHNNYRDILRQLANEMLGKEDMQESFNEITGKLFVDQHHIELTNKIQAITASADGSFVYDESWVCAIGTVSQLKRRRVGIAILDHPKSLGTSAGAIEFVILVLSPTDEQSSKSALETGRTFASLFSDASFRRGLASQRTSTAVIELLQARWSELQAECRHLEPVPSKNEYFDSRTYLRPALGLVWDIKRRSKHLLSDYLDGVRGDRTINKCLAMILFLYFSIILPAIAFGVLNSKHTEGKIETSKALLGQAIGGLIFAIFSGQHMIVLGTTALVSLYIRVVFEMSNQLEVDFYLLYACVGLWSSLFVALYSFFGLSYLIKYCTRSVEEIFAMFIFVCFSMDAIFDTIHNFQKFYLSPACSNASIVNTTSAEGDPIYPCMPESSLLFLLLMFGTLWTSIKVFNFGQSNWMTGKIREIVSSYALPIGVVLFSFLGSFVFNQVPVEQFEFDMNMDLRRAQIENLPWNAVLISAGLGFALSILFFMDQNITGQIVNSPTNNLKKGPAPHLDLLVLAILNAVLSIYSLPWMHGILPQSPLHVVGMADIKNGRITNVRETRITSIVCNLLILASLRMIPYPLGYIPVPVLDGLFLYCAVSSLRGSSFFERICLFFTEPRHIPDTIYTRQCRKVKMHTFTFLQLLQLVAIIAVGYSPYTYVQMAFPMVIALLIPVRHLIIPSIVSGRDLNALETYD